MDLGKLKPHHAELDILHPGDMQTSLGLTLTLRSLKSPEVQRVIEQHKEEQEREIKAGADSLNAAMATRQGIERIAACVVSWTWREAQPATDDQPAVEATTFNGGVPECSLANVAEVFTAADEVLQQVINFVRREAHFYEDFLPGS